jgi:hypothetical protein
VLRTASQDGSPAGAWLGRTNSEIPGAKRSSIDVLDGSHSLPIHPSPRRGATAPSFSPIDSLHHQPLRLFGVDASPHGGPCFGLGCSLSQTGLRLDRNPAPQRGADVTLTNAICCPELVGPANAIRSIEKARVHHASRRRDDVVAGGAGSAADASSDCVPQRLGSHCLDGQRSCVSQRLAQSNTIGCRASTSACQSW